MFDVPRLSNEIAACYRKIEQAKLYLVEDLLALSIDYNPIELYLKKRDEIWDPFTLYYYEPMFQADDDHPVIQILGGQALYHESLKHKVEIDWIYNEQAQEYVIDIIEQNRFWLYALQQEQKIYYLNQERIAALEEEQDHEALVKKIKMSTKCKVPNNVVL